jgi:hypothetical protein
MTESDRFTDNSSGIITDNKYKKNWLPKDSWGDLAQWRNYDEALAYVRLMNQVYAGGFSNWRLPTTQEAEEFYDEAFDHMDWEDEIIHICPLFVTKCSNYMWTSDKNESKEACRINLRNKELEYINLTTREHQSTRLVRNI